MKLLYVDVNGSFLNPTRNLLPMALRQAGDVDFFGPGYVGSEILKQGLNRYIELQGPFDLILTNSHFFWSEVYEIASQPNAYRTFYDLACSDDDLMHIPGILKDVRASGEVCALMFENDLYHASEREVEILNELAAYIVGLGGNFFLGEDEILSISDESFSNRITPHWSRYVLSEKQRIASLPAFVAESEFCWTPLANRSRDCHVPGVSYFARKQAKEALENAGYSVGKRPLAMIAESAARRLKLVTRASKSRQAFINRMFQNQLETSKFIFTCGSQIRIPIRKFFEIPAAGALMMCQPFEGFERAGFKHGENCLVADPRDLPKLVEHLKKNPDEAQAIASAGQALVWEKHSLNARAAHLNETLHAMVDGTFAGGNWEQGHYHVTRQKAG